MLKTFLKSFFTQSYVNIIISCAFVILFKFVWITNRELYKCFEILNNLHTHARAHAHTHTHTHTHIHSQNNYCAFFAFLVLREKVEISISY